MKQSVLLLAIALLLAACGGSGKSGKNSESAEVKWQEGDLCAILFLGYGKDFSAIAETDNFKKFCEQYSSLREITKFTTETEGDEVYYIIPRYGDATVTVREYGFDIENMKETIGKELYRGNNSPALIRCNISDIHPNTSVTVTGNGSSVTFNPMSGIGEGELQHIGESLSESLEMTLPALLSTECELEGIRAKIENGKVFLHFDLNKLQVTDFYEVPYELENKPYQIGRASCRERV